MFTLNSIIQQIELFQQNHEQLNSFYFGEISDVGASNAENYPMLRCVLRPEGSERGEALNSFYFDFAVLDIPNKTGNDTNVQECLSDTKLIADDLVAYFRYTKFETPLKIQLPVTMQSGTEMTDDEVTGWMFTIKMSLAQGLDLCAIPSVAYTPPIDYNKVRILSKATGAVLYRILAGQDFTIEELTEIIDTITANETTIIDPID